VVGELSGAALTKDGIAQQVLTSTSAPVTEVEIAEAVQ
jgi:hypothetical protein